MKRKQYPKYLILACAISSMTVPALALGQADMQNQPVYSNSSEASIAQQQAQQGAYRTHSSLEANLTRLTGLESQRRALQGSTNSHEVMATESALQDAEDMYMDQLSNMTGVSLEDLEKMHDAGVSYQEMAGELGVNAHAGQMGGGAGSLAGSRQGMGDSHTGSSSGMNSEQHGQLGLSGAGANSMMGARSGEIMSATARNTESGWSEGHGSGMQTNTGQDQDGSMMAGAGGLSNGMGSADGGGHGDGGMGASGSGGSGSGGGMGGSSGGGMGGSSGGSGGSGGGHGGGGGGGGGMM